MRKILPVILKLEIIWLSQTPERSPAGLGGFRLPSLVLEVSQQQWIPRLWFVTARFVSDGNTKALQAACGRSTPSSQSCWECHALAQCHLCNSSEPADVYVWCLAVQILKRIKKISLDHWMTSYLSPLCFFGFIGVIFRKQKLQFSAPLLVDTNK